MTERPLRRLARPSRQAVCAVAVLATTSSCSPNLTMLARQGRVREVCGRLDAEKEQLLRATDARLSFDVVPHARLAAEAGVELRGEPIAIALRAKVTQDPSSPFRVGVVDVAFSETQSVGVPFAYALPPMPHRERVHGSLGVSKQRSTATVIPSYVPQPFEDDVAVLVGRGELRLAEHPELFDGG